ncbi:MAG: cache domain-containing protein [Methanocorpusculum sp.]|nr:cache domain-containing protein [Methanocorpusculum sp.]
MLESKKDKLTVIGIVAVVAAVVVITVAAPAILAGTESTNPNLGNAVTLEDYVIQAMLYATEYGSDIALEEFNNPDGPFASSNYYIIAYDSDGTLLAMSENPSLVGENQLTVKDVYGVQSVMQCLIRAGHGGGYVYAISPEWFKGVEQTSGTTINLLYILPVDDKWFVFSGGEPRGVNAQMSMDVRNSLDTYVADAVSYVSKNGVEAAAVEFNKKNGLFSDDKMSLMMFDKEGCLITYQADSSQVGEDLRGFTDTRGTSVGRDIYQMGMRNGGYLYDAVKNVDGGIDDMEFISVVKIDDNTYLAGTYNIGTIEYTN